MPTGDGVAAAVVLSPCIGALQHSFGRDGLAVLGADFRLGREVGRLVRGQARRRRLWGLNRCDGRFSRVRRREGCDARYEHDCTHFECVKSA